MYKNTSDEQTITFLAERDGENQISEDVEGNTESKPTRWNGKWYFFSSNIFSLLKLEPNRIIYIYIYIYIYITFP